MPRFHRRLFRRRPPLVRPIWLDFFLCGLLNHFIGLTVTPGARAHPPGLTLLEDVVRQDVIPCWFGSVLLCSYISVRSPAARPTARLSGLTSGVQPLHSTGLPYSTPLQTLHGYVYQK
jgi:hypothetical protein